MKKINEILLMVFTLVLIFSGIFGSIANNFQIEKEETIFYLMNRLEIINGYYNVGIYFNESHSLENYNKYLSTETKPLTDKIESYNPKISKWDNLSKVFLYIAIAGNVFILILESWKPKRKGTKN